MTHAARALLALLALALSCAASGASQPPRDKRDTSTEPSEAVAWTTQHSRANNDNVVTQAPYPLRPNIPQPREDAHVFTNCTDLPGRTRQILPATSRRRHAFEPSVLDLNGPL